MFFKLVNSSCTRQAIYSSWVQTHVGIGDMLVAVNL